ncbi:MAG: hypothetical protein ACI9FR_003154 [Cryomorphaceae bacterium]|jgi:hypothetical protein
MLSNNPVLPNFAKTLVIATAAAMSVSAFAGHHEEAEKKIGDLKDMTTSEESMLKADEAGALTTTSSMLKGKAESNSKELSEEEMAKKAESLMPE